MSRLLVLFALASCAAQQKVVVSAPPPPPAAPTTPTCPTVAPSTAAFAPELVVGARVEKLCLLGAGDETSLRLREAIAPREGATLDAEGVRSDLTALVDTGVISQASAFAEPLGPKGVMLTYVVVERALISAVRIEGGTSLSADVLQRLEGKGIRDTLSQRNQRRDLARDFYNSQGFHDATIDFRQAQTAGGSELIIAIVEGPRFMVESVRFEGAKAVTAKELEKVVRTRPGTPVLLDRLEVDGMKLVALYYDRGHVMVTVEQKRLPHGATPGPTDVVFEIVEGPVFRVGTVSTKGVSLGAKGLAGIETKSGAIFSRAAVRHDLDTLRERAAKLGKIVEVVPLTELDQTRRTVALTFELTEKP